MTLFTHLTAVFWVTSTWARESARHCVHKDKYFTEFMFSGGDKSKSRGWKPYTRIDDRGENWNQLKNYWTGAPAPMGCVLGNAGVDWGKSKGKLPKVVRLIFGRSGLGLVWSVPGIPGSTGLWSLRKWKLHVHPDFLPGLSKLQHREMGPKERRACGNSFRTDQQIDRTE